MTPSINIAARNFLNDVVRTVEQRLTIKEVLGDVSDSDPEELTPLKVRTNQCNLINCRKMARTKQTARSSGSAVRTQGSRATFQWSSESDRELPTSPLSRRRASPARANTPPARKSPKQASNKRRRGMPDPSSPVAGDPNRGTTVSTKSREPKPAKAARKTGVPQAGIQQTGGTFTGAATRNNRRRRPRRHYVPPPLRRDERGNVL